MGSVDGYISDGGSSDGESPSWVQLPLTSFFRARDRDAHAPPPPCSVRAPATSRPASAAQHSRRVFAQWQRWIDVERGCANVGGTGRRIAHYLPTALGNMLTLPIDFPSPHDSGDSRSALSEVCAMEWDGQGVLLAVGSVNGLIRIYDHDEMCLQLALLRNACNRGSRVALSTAPAVSLVRYDSDSY